MGLLSTWVYPTMYQIKYPQTSIIDVAEDVGRNLW